MAVIYKIKNEVNGKIYVGFTTKNPPGKRFSEHKSSSYNGSPTHLHRAMRKHGTGAFSFEVLEETTDVKHAIGFLEPKYINELKPEYNMTLGGEGRTGYHLSEESRKKISKAQKGIPNATWTNEHRQNMSIAHKKSEKTQQHLWIVSESLKGIPRTEEVKLKCRTKMLGHPTTVKTRKKISEKLMGRKNGPAPIVICPHCKKSGGNNSMPRWHFDNCKKREVRS